jgi:hypothetical protein
MTMTVSHVHSTSTPALVTALNSERATATTLASSPSSAPLVPEPLPVVLGGDVAAEIAALAVQTGESQRDIDSKAAETEDNIQDNAAQAEVATMHDEASTMRAGAWEGGLLQIGAGACSIASAGASIGAKPGSDAAGWAAGLNGTSQSLMGGATIAGGLSKAAGTDSQALATAQKALSDSAQRAGLAARDGQKNATDFVQSALDFYRQYETAKAEAQAAALHGA